MRQAPSVTSALKWGAAVGAGYYILALLFTLLLNLIESAGGNSATANPLLLVPICLSYFALGFTLFAAGYLAAFEREHIAPGLASVVVMLVVTYVLSLIIALVTHSGGPAQATGTSLGAQIVALLFDVAAAGLIGWTGAFYGVKNKLKRNARGPQSG